MKGNNTMKDNSLNLQKQWLRRSADECFADLPTLHQYNVKKREITRQQTVNLAELQVVSKDNDIAVIAAGKELQVSNFAFTRLAQQIGASPDYLRRLSPELVASNLNYGLANIANGSKPVVDLQAWEIDESGRSIDVNAKLIYENNDQNRLVNVVGDKYSILFDAQLSEFAIQLQEKFGLLPAPATTNGDINHRGLYASDRDCFIFLSNCDKEVLQFANSPIYRGIMLWNGYGETFGVSLFLFSGICCNYSIHQFTEKYSFTMRHTANFHSRFKPVEALDKLALGFDNDCKVERDWAKAAQSMVIGKTEEDLTDNLIKLRSPLLGKKTVQHLFEMSCDNEDIYGVPGTVWSVGNCLTEIARDKPIASTKRDYMQVAQKVFDMAL
jgi:hypothetical protein